MRRQDLRLWMSSGLLLLLVWPPVLRAEGEDLRVLRHQVEELKGTVQVLQDRIDALERKNGSAVAPLNESARVVPVELARSVAKPVEQRPTALENSKPDQRESVDDKIVALRRSWHRIAAGMNRDEVSQALGPPTQEMQINSKLAWYYYYAGIGAGSVFFKGNGLVSSSQPPSIGWGF